MEPLISVVVVTYNRARYLKEALDSILRQTFKNYEIILVDDGSVDNTKEIVEQYEGIRYIYQEHGGISKARNTAVKAAKGKWIATLDSDDLWKKEKLQKQVDYLEAHPECRIVYTAFCNFADVSEDILNERQAKLLQSAGRSYLPSALIDARLFDEIGLYDETIEWGEDIEWIFRSRFFKIDIGHCIDEVLYLRRVHGSNISITTKEISNLGFWKMASDAYRKIKRDGKQLKR
ncbi:MAG: glycosyltransferase family 2 protein [Acidaminococcaceae bacterium]|nr:glycosyltransferase family 2 protein [Acidaminococcaceae bacterium]